MFVQITILKILPFVGTMWVQTKTQEERKMASLRNIVRDYRDEIRDGIAWVVVYKEGRSWNAKAVWPDDGDYEDGYTLDKGDLEELISISRLDGKAICFNGYYCGFGEDFTLADIENKILGFYMDRRMQLTGDFLECMVDNIDDAEAPDTEELASEYIEQYEGTNVVIESVNTFDVTGYGVSDHNNPVVYCLSDGTYWLWTVNGYGCEQIRESLFGEELVFDENDGYVVKTSRGTRTIKWVN